MCLDCKSAFSLLLSTLTIAKLPFYHSAQKLINADTYFTFYDGT